MGRPDLSYRWLRRQKEVLRIIVCPMATGFSRSCHNFTRFLCPTFRLRASSCWGRGGLDWRRPGTRVWKHGIYQVSPFIWLNDFMKWFSLYKLIHIKVRISAISTVSQFSLNPVPPGSFCFSGLWAYYKTGTSHHRQCLLSPVASGLWTGLLLLSYLCDLPAYINIVTIFLKTK